jgi:hypothetical protein
MSQADPFEFTFNGDAGEFNQLAGDLAIVCDAMLRRSRCVAARIRNNGDVRGRSLVSGEAAA